ncbi:DUF688 domain-containing protein [Cephalotus follicularis]|uniref:DUF688 domain-containing protein n=1 Tax=Cephalotus follicularis TaxID=3775 RepID=A0A1Q3BEA6_CEPFO|nr:DUF688 domain-containing protein [Cephalotus follicularis]
MGLERDEDCEPSSTPPKLSLFSFPNKAQEKSAWMLTPPIHSSVSIPFQWEEAPGKPKPCSTRSKSSTTAARCLELPPRLLSETKVNAISSPTTVLDGPDAGRSLSYKLPHGKGGSFRSPEDRHRIIFGSNRWRMSFKKNKEVVAGAFDFSSPVSQDGDYGGGGGGCGTHVKITRVRRKASFLSFSHSRSHLWTNIYESFKQVVPWRHRQEKSRKMSL